MPDRATPDRSTPDRATPFRAMAQRTFERPTLPVVNREAAEILEQFLNRRHGGMRPRPACHEAIEEEGEERGYRLKVSECKVTASCEVVALDDHGGADNCESGCDNRPRSLPADFRNKVNADEDITVLLNSIRKDASGRQSDRRRAGVNMGGRRCSVDSSDSSDNYPDEDWLRQKPRKKKNFFKRTKERLQHAFTSQHKKARKQRLLYTDIGVLAYSDSESRKRGRRKKGSRAKEAERRVVDGYSSATRSESTTPGRPGDVLVDQRACSLKRVQSDEVFKHRRVTLKNASPGAVESPISVVGQFRDKILDPIRRSFRRSKSKGQDSGSNTTEAPVKSDPKDPIFRRPKPDIPRPLLPGDDDYAAPKSTHDSKAAVKVFKEILGYDFPDGLSPRVESPSYVNFNCDKEPIYADIDNAHSQTSFEDIDDPDQDPVWVLRVEGDDLGGGCRNDLFLPGLVGGPPGWSCGSASVTKTEFSYQTLKFEERRSRNVVAVGAGLGGKGGLYGIIAQKLATIADTCVARIDSESTSHSESDTAKNRVKTAVTDPANKDALSVEKLNSLEKQIIMCLRQSGDKIAETHDFPTSTAVHLVHHAGYGAFKKTMQNTIGSEPGWDQVAMLFYVANSAVRLAGASGAIASKVKEHTLRYFEDKFAEWIVGQGGWDSMLEDTSTPDTELD